MHCVSLQVFIVLNTGRLVLCEAEIPLSPVGNYSPVKTECPGNNKPIHCIAVLPKPLKYVFAGRL